MMKFLRWYVRQHNCHFWFRFWSDATLLAIGVLIGRYLA